MREPLIIGVDPGTTLAYALLDFKGNLIRLKSSRTMSLSSLISEVIEYGDIVAVTTDVNPPASLVVKFSSSTCSRLMFPDHKLLYREKRKLIDNFLKRLDKRIKINNRHERDALASAIYGHKRLKQLFIKIDDYLEKINRQDISSEVKKIVLLNDVAIKRAVSLAAISA